MDRIRTKIVILFGATSFEQKKIMQKCHYLLNQLKFFKFPNFHCYNVNNWIHVLHIIEIFNWNAMGCSESNVSDFKYKTVQEKLFNILWYVALYRWRLLYGKNWQIETDEEYYTSHLTIERLKKMRNSCEFAWKVLEWIRVEKNELSLEVWENFLVRRRIIPLLSRSSNSVKIEFLVKKRFAHRSSKLRPRTIIGIVLSRTIRVDVLYRVLHRLW